MFDLVITACVIPFQLTSEIQWFAHIALNGARLVTSVPVLLWRVTVAEPTLTSAHVWAAVTCECVMRVPYPHVLPLLEKKDLLYIVFGILSS